MKHNLIVMIGVAGIGKSYLAKHILDTHEDCTIVSRDAIRFAKLQEDDDYFKYEDEVEANYYNAISAAIQTHEYVIADATHITKKSRRKLFSNISLPSGTKVIGVYVEAPLSTALRQNAMRTGRARVPEDVIKRMFKQKVSPQENEPFDEVIYISKDADMALGNGSDGIKTVFEKLEQI